MDPTGADPIDDLLSSAIQSGTRILFPPGEYRLEQPKRVDGVVRHAWIGTGTSRGDVRLRLSGEIPTQPLTVSDSQDICLEGFDFVTDGTTPVELGFDVDGTLSVANVGVSVDESVDSPSVSFRSTRRSHSTQTLSVVGRGALASYEVTVSGEIKPDPSGPSYTSPKKISGPSAEGTILDDTDQYIIDGTIGAFSLRGPATVRVDGRPVSPTRLPSKSGSVATIQPRSGSESVIYQLEADAPVKTVGSKTAKCLNGSTKERTSTAEGWVTDGQFGRFNTRDGSARLLLDDVLISPDALSAPQNALLVGGDLSCSFSTGGRLHKDADPTLGGGTLTESVREKSSGGGHYRFDGPVEQLTLKGRGCATLTFE
jgi:hypothetical protein